MILITLFLVFFLLGTGVFIGKMSSKGTISDLRTQISNHKSYVEGAKHNIIQLDSILSTLCTRYNLSINDFSTEGGDKFIKELENRIKTNTSNECNTTSYEFGF